MVELRERFEVKATFKTLDRFLDEFHRRHADKQWFYKSVPDSNLFTRLWVRTPGRDELYNDQKWIVEARDIDDYLEGTHKFCYITACLGEKETNTLWVDFWRSCPEGAARSSYPEYLALLLGALHEQGMIKLLPDWAKKHVEPWNEIPDHGYDRLMVEMLHEGYTDPEIANRVGKDSKTIRNRLSILRGKYGSEIVPRRASLKERWKSGQKSGHSGY